MRFTPWAIKDRQCCEPLCTGWIVLTVQRIFLTPACDALTQPARFDPSKGETLTPGWMLLTQGWMSLTIVWYLDTWPTQWLTDYR